MEISQAARMKICEEVDIDTGFIERDPGELTARELANEYGVYVTGLPQYLYFNKIEYTRRKALANGRKKFVYKLIKE